MVTLQRKKLLLYGVTTCVMVVLQSQGCTCITQGMLENIQDMPPTPVVDSLPDLTQNTQITVTGTKVRQVQVLLQTENQDQVQEVTPIDENEEWSTTLELKEGSNSFVVLARTKFGFISEPSLPVTIVRDTTPPAQPVILDPVTQIQIHRGASSATLHLIGNKDNESNLVLDGNEIVARYPASTEWRWDVSVLVGDNHFEFWSVDWALNESAHTTLDVTVLEDTTPPALPTFDNCPTDSIALLQGEVTAPLTLHGEKDIDGVVVVRVNGEEKHRGWEGLSQWSTDLTLALGPNSIEITAEDSSENASAAEICSVQVRQYVEPPQVDPPPPERTRESSIQVCGTKAAQTRVFFVEVQDPPAEPQTVAGSAADRTWCLDNLSLASDGDHTIQFWAENEYGDASAQVEIVITRDTQAPPPPIAQACSSLFYFEPGEIHAQCDISGNKQAGSYLLLDGVTQNVLAQAESWTITVNISPTTNIFTFVATDDLGNSSAATEVQVEGVEGLFRPSVSLPRYAVNDPHYVLSGLKQSGAAVYFRWASEVPGDSRPITGLTNVATWSHALSLGDDGPYEFYLHVENASGQKSREIGPLQLVLDTVAPASPDVSHLPTLTETEDLLIDNARKDADANVCVRQNGEPNCVLIAAIDGLDRFSASISLVPGRNDLCFESHDEAGNVSPQACVTITLVAAPTVEMLWPVNGAALSGTAFHATVRASDVSVPIVSVSLCFGSDGCVDAVRGADTDVWEATLSLATAQDGQSYPLTVTAVNDSSLEGHANIDLVYFQNPISISENVTTTDSRAADLAVGLNGDVHVVWQDSCWDSISPECPVGSQATFAHDIFYRRWDGLDWTQTVNLSQIQGDADSIHPQVVVDATGDVHVVWQENGDIRGNGGTDWNLVHRIIRGGSWQIESPTVLTLDCSPTCFDDRSPDLAADSAGGVHLVWERGLVSRDIFYRKWSQGIWSVASLVSNDINDGNSMDPSIAIDRADEAVIAWRDDGNIQSNGADFDIYLRVIGSSAIIPISDTSSGFSKSPSISVGRDGAVRIVWSDNADLLASGLDEFEIWYRMYDIATGSLSSVERISDASVTGNSAMSPCVVAALQDHKTFIAWADNGGMIDGDTDYDIYLSLHEPGFADYFGLISRGEQNSQISFSPKLVLDEGINMIAAWEDRGSGAPDDFDISFTMLSYFYRQ